MFPNKEKLRKAFEGDKLIILHQCGEYKDALIGQLKTMIHNIETNGEDFAS